jgi:hypothetical protein
MTTIESRTLVISPGWLKAKYRPGARCSECKTRFTRKSPADGIACVRNGAGGNDWYPLCSTCGSAYRAHKDAGIPNCAAQSKAPSCESSRAPLNQKTESEMR